MVFYLWQQAFQRSNAGYASAIAIALLVVTLAFSIVNVRLLERGARARMSDVRVAVSAPLASTLTAARQPRALSPPGAAARSVAARWLAGMRVLTALAVVTVFPFVWMLLTSLKGPARCHHLGAAAVPAERPDARELREGAGTACRSRASSSTAPRSPIAIGLLNVLVAALAAYPLAKMRFLGREAIFYALLATLIVPAQLTYIPSFVLAVNVFHYYDSLPALIFPNIVSAFNIFLLRQAFRERPAAT